MFLFAPSVGKASVTTKFHVKIEDIPLYPLKWLDYEMQYHVQ